MDPEWVKSVNNDIKSCNEIRVRLEEHDKAQQKEIDEGKKERMELYDHKNEINNKLTFLDTGKVDYKTFNVLSKCVATLKAEKRFLPYTVMIISALAGLGSLVYVIVRLGGS